MAIQINPDYQQVSQLVLEAQDLADNLTALLFEEENKSSGRKKSKQAKRLAKLQEKAIARYFRRQTLVLSNPMFMQVIQP